MPPNIVKQFFALESRRLVSDGVKTYRVSSLISVDSVLAVDLATKEDHRLPVETLKLVAGMEGSGTQTQLSNDRDLLSYDEEE